MDILATNETFSAPMDATYSLLGVSPSDVTTLEQYLQVCARAASLCWPGCYVIRSWHEVWAGDLLGAGTHPDASF